MAEKYNTALVTGGAGFIGSHFIRHLLKAHPHMKVINVDALTYCGNLDNIKDVSSHARYRFYHADIGDFKTILAILKRHKVDVVVNFAAESDNNKAIHSPMEFARTNALGTAVLLEAARMAKVKRFHHISTCEVFGELALKSTASFTEASPYRPRTPYNASKAASDLLVKSYHHTFGLPITISYAANNYGSHQFPEKVIPVFTVKALHDEKLPVFKSSGNKREWIHVLDHCRAVDFILHEGAVGETYNIGTGLEKTIRDVASDILRMAKKPAHMITIVPDRPGHDSRYLLDSKKLRKLGWKPTVQWEEGLAETVKWYQDNPRWWKPLLKRSHSWKRKTS